MTKRVRKAGDDIAEGCQALVDVLCFFKADALRLRLADSLGAGQVHQDQSAFEVLDLVCGGGILPMPSLVDIDMKDGVRAT